MKKGLIAAIYAFAEMQNINQEYYGNSSSGKYIDVYRKYVPNPDQQPRNEKCKCGSGKKYKHCCIKR